MLLSKGMNRAFSHPHILNPPPSAMSQTSLPLHSSVHHMPTNLLRPVHVVACFMCLWDTLPLNVKHRFCLVLLAPLGNVGIGLPFKYMHINNRVFPTSHGQRGKRALCESSHSLLFLTQKPEGTTAGMWCGLALALLSNNHNEPVWKTGLQGGG